MYMNMNIKIDILNTSGVDNDLILLLTLNMFFLLNMYQQIWILSQSKSACSNSAIKPLEQGLDLLHCTCDIIGTFNIFLTLAYKFAFKKVVTLGQNREGTI